MLSGSLLCNGSDEACILCAGAPIENIDRILNEQDKMFQKDFGMGVFPMHDRAMMMVKNPVETYKDDNADAYKMIINLKPFNNNPKKC